MTGGAVAERAASQRVCDDLNFYLSRSHYNDTSPTSGEGVRGWSGDQTNEVLTRSCAL